MTGARLLALTAALALSACEGVISGPDPKGAALPGPAGISPGEDRNNTVFEKLRVTCESCHGENQSKPYFASIDAFETLLVYAPGKNYVVAGKPEESELLKLLRGTGSGAQRQMPPQGETFAERADRGATPITMAELEEWIRTLPPRGTRAVVAAQSSVHRKDAEHIIAALKSQLGLTDADFYTPHPTYDLTVNSRPDDYSARSGDGTVDVQGSGIAGIAQTFFVLLGGPDWLGSKPRNNTVSSTFTQLFVGMSQAWCRKAIEKSGNQAIFQKASPSDRLATRRDAIRGNMADLYLTMLGQPASATDLDGLERLFAAYEPDSTITAWTAVCSALVRDPLWLVF